MSQPEIQDPEKGRLMADDYLNINERPLSQSRQSQGETNIGDSSGPLFAMYTRLAVEEDNKMAERWQKDAEGILIFTGLFSAVVTALAAVSVQDLRPNPQDNSSFYLEKLYRLQAERNISHTSVALVEEQPPAFSPPLYAVWVNMLWFLSLVISLTCAMLATLLQQWARRYIRTTQQPRRTQEKRAQIRAFFANGVERFHVSWAVEALPAMVHLSLFVFFAGLLIFLFNINHTVCRAVACWVALASTVYACITFMPIFWHDSPYYAPLSSAVWLLYTTITYVLLVVTKFIRFRHHQTFPTWGRLCKLVDRYRGWILGGIGRAAEETTTKRSSQINSRIVEWTVDTLSEDDSLERFLETIPGFYQSDIDKPLGGLIPQEVQERIEVAAGKFLDRTLSSGPISMSVIERRLSTCLNVLDVVGGPFGVAVLLRTMTEGSWHGGPHSIEIGHFLMRWFKSRDRDIIVEVHFVIACILKSVPVRDDSWKALALDHLGVSEDVLEGYLAHGDSVLLANFNNVTRQLALSRSDWTPTPITGLRKLSEFDIRNTLPGLTDEFCLMWNALVLDARSRGEDSPPVVLLSGIRHLYIALHRGTKAAPTLFSDSTQDTDGILYHPSSYPYCHYRHGSDPAEEGDHADDPVLTTSPVALSHDDDPADDCATVTPPTASDITTFPTPDPDNTIPHTRDESSLGDVLSIITTLLPSHSLTQRSRGGSRCHRATHWI